MIINNHHKNRKFFDEDKTLSNAYRNVINVIANILEDIEDQKINGKANFLNMNAKTTRKGESDFIRKSLRINKNINIDKSSRQIKSIEKSFCRSSISKKAKSLNSSSSSFIINHKNKNIPIINVIRADNNKEKSKKKLFNKTLNIIKSSDINNSFNSTNRNINIFPTSKANNVLMAKNRRSLFERGDITLHHSNKTFPKKILKELSIIKKESSKNSIISFNDDDTNSISSNSFIPLNSQKKEVRKTLTDNDKPLNIKIKDSLNLQKSSRKDFKSKSIINAKNKRINKSKSGKIMIQSNTGIQNKLTTVKNIKKKLYDYENNEITHEINKLPNQEISKEDKIKNKRRKTLIFTKELKDIIDLNPDIHTIMNHFNKYNKEKNYRCLLFKGNVYDSLNDDEESEVEIDENFCYLEPNSNFLYIFDSIILISSLIILLYLPYSLAKNLYYCQNILDINTIIFYCIDFFYIIDLILYFYRSYYNFDEYLVKQSFLICINYIKTWFLLDFISAIPIYSILKSFENKCVKNKFYNNFQLNNNGKYSRYYNTNPHNTHYLLLLIKIIKTFKIYKKNITLRKIGKYLCGSDFLTDWGNVILYSFFLLSFLNLSACFFIFIGRNSYNSWIFINSLETQNFFHLYISSIYYVIETVTTVGYGDLIGKTISEIIFQVINLISGTCIYSWLISSISNYIVKMNEKNTNYEKKMEILEEIKLNNPHLSNKLYQKILRLLHYRKYHEDETEKNIVLNSLPNSLKNSLIIEMYKKFINDFIFFRGIDNKEFIVQIISKLKPIIGIKGDTLIKEGEHIDDIIFIKDGVLSLEVCINLKYPEKSIEEYLIQNEYIKKIEINKEKTITKTKKNNENNFKLNKSYKPVKQTKKSTYINYYYGMMNKNEKGMNNSSKFNNFLKDTNDSEQDYEIEKNIKRIKILDIRKNEHFGDVLMFLNKKSPLYVRVRSNKADLLLLKKLDALKISTNYPTIWKKMIKKPLANSKLIQNLTLRMLAIFCNYYGIKTQLFKKKKKNEEYPPYYLKPVLNDGQKKILKKKKEEKEDKLQLLNSLKNLEVKSTQLNEDNSNNFIDSSNQKNNENNQKNKSDIMNENYSKKNKLKNNFINKNEDLIKKEIINNKFHSMKEIKYINFKSGIFESNEKKDVNISKAKSRFFSSDKNIVKNNNFNNNYDSNQYASSFSFKNPKITKKNNSYKIAPNYSHKNKTINLNPLNNNYKPTLFQKYDINKEKEEKDKISKISLELNYDTENNDFRPDDINDEIYPGEEFIIKNYENEIPKNIIITNKDESTKIITDNVYINNYNIIKTPSYKAFFNNNYNIQNNNDEKEKNKIFENLKISSSISIIEINSSYENINQITNNIYLTNNELKIKTKNFLLNECKQIEEQIFTNITNKNKDIKELKTINTRNKKTKGKFYKNIKSRLSNNILLKNKTNNNFSINNLLDSHKHNSSIKNYEKENMLSKLKSKKMSSCITLNLKNNLDYINNINIIKEKNPLEDKKKCILEENQENSNDINLSNAENKPLEESFNSNSKRKKKEKEMDIISLNIEQSSQNLNQPDLFYADLFSQLILRKTRKNKLNYSPKIWKKENEIISERNEIQEMEESKSQREYSKEIKSELNK